ncbi:molybdate ABC transporter substrate-binding protein [Croceibacterium sp. TMG7-5b_MA50]|uniref:molybdate ABC transporter substrate-binding protein n=1 Tax=Croceibacterium sp. TMG7-5b_MA50 TaxID=3121290 RepID=UPI003221BFFB
MTFRTASRSLLSAVVGMLLAGLLAACSAERDGTAGGGPVVLAAASLQEALSDAGAAWAAQGHPAPRLSYAGSSVLARQVEAGAPADLFVSADEQWMDYLEERRLLRPGTRVTIASGELVLVAPTRSMASGLVALAQGQVAMADPVVVPAGRYGKAALEQLGLWAGVADRVIPAENVRAALALVERGEVPLGIVYATDARASDQVKVIHRFAPGSHPPIRYPAAVLAGATHADAAAFLQFLRSPAGQRLLAARGFGPAAE